MNESPMKYVELGKIHVSDDNPRKSVGDVDEMAASMKSHGVLEPLIVTPNGTGYVLVCGARRLAAARKAKLGKVPAVVRDYDDRGRIEAMVIENLQREDLTVLEEADSYQRLIGLGHSQREIAKRIGRAQGHVSKRLALLELPEHVQKQVDSGGITLEDAQELSKLRDDPDGMGKAIKEVGRSHYLSIGEAVRLQVARKQREAKVAKAIAALEKKGVKVLKVEGSDWNMRLPKGVFAISGSSYDALSVDAKKHEKKPCHAVAVNVNTGTVTPVCTDRKQHPKAKTGNERHNDDRQAQRAELEQEHGRWEKAAGTRRAFLADLLVRRLPKSESIALIVRGYFREILDSSWYYSNEAEDVIAIAIDLLGIAPAESEPESSEATSAESEIEPTFNAGQAIDELIAKSESEQLRVGAALALAGVESKLEGRHVNLQPGSEAEQHLSWCKQHGYTPTKVERDSLAEAAKRAAEQAKARAEAEAAATEAQAA